MLLFIFLLIIFLLAKTAQYAVLDAVTWPRKRRLLIEWLMSIISLFSGVLLVVTGLVLLFD